MDEVDDYKKWRRDQPKIRSRDSCKRAIIYVRKSVNGCGYGRFRSGEEPIDGQKLLPCPKPADGQCPHDGEAGCDPPAEEGEWIDETGIIDEHVENPHSDLPRS